MSRRELFQFIEGEGLAFHKLSNDKAKWRAFLEGLTREELLLKVNDYLIIDQLARKLTQDERKRYIYSCFSEEDWLSWHISYPDYKTGIEAFILDRACQYKDFESIPLGVLEKATNKQILDIVVSNAIFFSCLDRIPVSILRKISVEEWQKASYCEEYDKGPRYYPLLVAAVRKNQLQHLLQLALWRDRIREFNAFVKALDMVHLSRDEKAMLMRLRQKLLLLRASKRPQKKLSNL